MGRQAHQFFHGGIRRVFVVRMHAHRRPQMGVRLDQRHQAGPFGHVDADHQRVRHLVGGHALQDGGQVGGQFGEIQMAVGIDVHGNPGCGRRPGPGRRRARAGRGRRAARDYARQDSTTRWSAEWAKSLAFRGAWPARAGASASARLRPRGPAGRARPLAPRPRPAREVAHRRGGGQHQVGIEALQRVDPVGRRHLSSASASVPTSGDWPCASGATNWPSHGDRRPRRSAPSAGPPAARRRRPPAIRGRVRRSARAAIAARCRHRAPAGQAAAARHQGRQQPVGRIRHQQEHRVGRRLFQHLEQRVGRDHVQRMGRIQ